MDSSSSSFRQRGRALQAQLPTHLPLKIANTLTYWSLVAFHLYNTFFYVPPATAKETYLSPGLYAYWVWPLIHLLLLGFTVCQWIPRAHSLVIESIGYRFVVISLISAAWLYFQYRRWYILSFFLSLALLAVVSKVFYIVRTRQRLDPEPTKIEWAVKEACIHVPFSLYHAWSLVLMILTLVQAFGKDVHREHAGGWTRVFVMMALLFLCLNSIGYAYASEVGDLAGTAVITYVLWAIFEHQTSVHTIHWSALVCAVVSSLAFLVTLQSSIFYFRASKQPPMLSLPTAPASPTIRRPRAGSRTRSAQGFTPVKRSAKAAGARPRSATVAGSGGASSSNLGPPPAARRKISSADERTPLLRRVSEGGGAQ